MMTIKERQQELLKEMMDTIQRQQRLIVNLRSDNAVLSALLEAKRGE
jgi:hypothetical protein